MRKLETRKSLELAQVHTVAMDRAGSRLPGHPPSDGGVPGHSSRLQTGGRKYPSPSSHPTPNPLKAGLSQESKPHLPTPTSPHFPCGPSHARTAQSPLPSEDPTPPWPLPDPQSLYLTRCGALGHLGGYLGGSLMQGLAWAAALQGSGFET